MATGTPALIALHRAGISFTSHPYQHDPRARAFGEESVAALGLRSDQVFKTLIALVDGDPTVGIVPVSGHLDLKALAHAAGGRRAEMASSDLAERITGYVVGGISPIGLKRPLPAYLDEQAVLFDVVYVSGGRRGLSLGLSPDDLLRAAQAIMAPIARDDRP